MKISTPTATMGIRGTTGLIEVPEGASATSRNNVAIKLYPDPDGKVGRIEVNDRAGARIGFLTQGASGFAIRGGGGMRVAAVPLTISPQQALRDQGFVRTAPTSRVNRARSAKMVCRSGRVRRSRDSQTGRDSNHRAFLTGRGCSSGRVRRRNRVRNRGRGCHRNRACHRARVNRNNPVCKDNPGRRTGLALRNRQIFNSQICSGNPASGRARPDCSGPDCKTGLRCCVVRAARRQKENARRTSASG